MKTRVTDPWILGAGIVFLGVLTLLGPAARAEDDDEDEPGPSPTASVVSPVEPGWLRASGAEGSGFEGQLAGVTDLNAAMRQGREELERQLGQPVRVLAAAAQGETAMQAMVATVKAGAPATGILGARVASGGAAVSFSFTGAVKAAEAPPEELVWQKVPLPDGTGALDLPAGWQITLANKGMVSANGPQGAIELGTSMSVCTPELAARWAAQGMTGMLTARFGEPEEVVAELLPQLMAKAGPGAPTLTWKRLIDRSPVEYPAGKAAFLHFECEKVAGGVPELLQTVALVIVSMNSDGTLFYYASAVTAPTATFARDLKVLNRIWGSWKISDAEYRRRLDLAMSTMRETSKIMQSVTEDRGRSRDATADAVGDLLRGVTPVLDRATNEFSTPDANVADKMVEALNKAEGAERWKLVSRFELNPRR